MTRANGGYARARKLTAARRSEIATAAAKARWASTPRKRSLRFPWNIVRRFTVKSCADGTLLIEPDYINPYRGPAEGGGPGLFTRMALAHYCEKRLAKRGSNRS